MANNLKMLSSFFGESIKQVAIVIFLKREWVLDQSNKQRQASEVTNKQKFTKQTKRIKHQQTNKQKQIGEFTASLCC